MARTFNDLSLFRDDADRRFFLSCLEKRIQETGFACYAWVLMDTHVHLLIRTTEEPLWKLMKPLNGDYARYYNLRYDRRGPLFCDRYKSIATQDQFYLEHLVRHIHLNPIRAGICRTIEQLGNYRWSGHRAIMYNEENGFQDIRTVLKRFGKTKSLACRNYDTFMRAGIGNDDAEEFTRAVRASNESVSDKDKVECWVIGDKDFQQSVLEKAKENHLSLARYRREGIDLKDLLILTSEKTGIAEHEILTRSKRSAQADARMVFCCFAVALEFPTFEIGRFLGIGQAAVSHAARKGRVIAREKGISLKKI
jgi:REP element-mobilizing transposase RayT